MVPIMREMVRESKEEDGVRDMVEWVRQIAGRSGTLVLRSDCHKVR
jgi:hypothetical protein